MWFDGPGPNADIDFLSHENEKYVSTMSGNGCSTSALGYEVTFGLSGTELDATREVGAAAMRHLRDRFWCH